MHNKKGFYQWCICLMLTLASTAAIAQNGINSPYSQYGIGLSNQPYNHPSVNALGGVTYTRADNNTVNPFNPASYAAIGNETFVFDMGLSIEMSTLRNQNASQFDADGNMGYIAMAFPLWRWWKTSIGLMPLSDVNYQSVHTIADVPGGPVKTIYEGTGGVAALYWGHGFNILGGADPEKTQLRAGFNINYLYGTLTRAITQDFEANDSTYFMDSRNQKDTYIKNFTFDFGVQFEQPLGHDHRFGAALTLKPPRKMRVKDNALVYTFVTANAGEYIRDTIFPSAGQDSEYESDLEQPLTTGIGLFMQHNNHWRVAFDATFAPWSGLKYSENEQVNIFGTSPLRYSDNYRLALGFQLLGDKSASNYLRRITYSAGLHYESGRLALQLTDNSDYQLNEWGCGIGMSLPMRKGRSVLNLSVGYTSFGTIDLLRRDALTIGISIGSCESWFVKRKFN